MSKKLLITVVIVFLGSFSITYFLLNKDKVPEFSISSHIPMLNNGIVGTINYAAFESIVMKEMFRNPSMLMGLKNDFSDQQFITTILSAVAKGGFDKDQKVVFSISPKHKKEGFLLLAVDDAKRLNENLVKQLKAYTSDTIMLRNSLMSNYYAKEKTGVFLSHNFLCIIYAEKQNVKSICKQISEQKKCYPAHHSKIDKLINNEHHISVWSVLNEKEEDVFTHVDFKDGKLLINASVVTEKKYLKTEPSIAYVCDSCAASFHLDASNLSQFSALLTDSISQQLDSITHLINIDVQQFLNLSNGKIDAVIINKGYREDKIITYEFDDDFNKVKREKIEVFPIVNFIMTLGTEEAKLYYQFKKQGIIKSNDAQELFTNPIGKCFVKKELNGLQLTSNRDLFDGSIQLEKVNQPLFFKANFDKLLQTFSQHDTIKVQPFNTLFCEAYQKDSLISIKLELTAKKASQNILFDIVDVAASKKE